MSRVRYSRNDFIPIILAAVVLAGVAMGVFAFYRRTGMRPGGNSTSDWIIDHDDGGTSRVHLGASEIPSEFPPDVTFFPGSKFEMTTRTSASVILSLTTPSPQDAVLAHFRTLAGYEVVYDAEDEGTRILHLRHAASGKELRVLVELSGRPTEYFLRAAARPSP